MHRKTIILLSYTIFFSYLFYNQNIGSNVLIYSTAFLLLLGLLFRKSIFQKQNIVIAAAAIISSIGCLIHGSELALWGTIISFLVLLGYLHQKRSIIFNILNSFFNLLASIPFAFNDINNAKARKNPLFILSFLVPLLLSLIFYSIYRNINPLFEDLTRNFAISNISIDWVFVTFLGFIIVLSPFHYKSLPQINDLVSNQTYSIKNNNIKTSKWDESLAFNLLFILLNLMLIAVNIMDLNYLYLGEGLPENVSHKQFVHKGVGMLIFSIFLGISILIFFFRGKLNFENNISFSKGLALFWILQNLFMVISTAMRNNIYVSDALLSYKRLGVYFWLLLAFIGLIYTAIKVLRNKSAWYLIQNNINTMFFVFILSTLINWDSVISNFNIKRANEMIDIGPIDKNYLLSLSETNIADLYTQINKKGFQYDPAYSYLPNCGISNKNCLDIKLFRFLEEEHENNWPSFSFMRRRVNNEIDQLFKKGNIKTLDLRNTRISSLAPLQKKIPLLSINLSGTFLNEDADLGSLNNFEFEHIQLDGNNIGCLETLKTNTQLNSLSLNNNKLTKLGFIDKFNNLETLYLEKNKVMQVSSIPEGHGLTYLSLSDNPLNDIEDLTKLTKLEHLKLNNLEHNAGPIPHLSLLKYIEANNSPNFVKYAFKSNTRFQNVINLSLSGNEINHLDVLFTENHSLRFPSLNVLNLSNNKIRSIKLLQKYPGLTSIDLSYNDVDGISVLIGFVELEQLFLRGCNIKDISSVEKLNKIVELDISNNDSISDFSFLNALKSLNKLNVSHTEFNNLKDIESLSYLRYLDLTKCRVSNFYLFERFPMLDTLKLSYLEEREIKYLKYIYNLKQLTLSDCSNNTYKKLKEELNHVKIYFSE
jgi:hypothetical protein